ncbi:zinc finger matrin-type protein 5 [Haematobia irritans]|uniref:zinc finger matrin-type protein 5 n=1 Tax=Haematobia irritans TaxID=7368 RepID=UPI003F50CBC0
MAMGGKSYFCDYCQCFMKNNINVRKTHNDALLHKMIKIRYMRRFEDPRKIYEIESHKPPCSHFLKGRCRYDLFCQSSHYNKKQLDELQQIANNLNKKTNTVNKATSKQLPWTSWNEGKFRKKKKANVNDLPPSLRPIQLKKLYKVLDKNNTWG